jgi:hypothetical protein
MRYQRVGTVSKDAPVTDDFTLPAQDTAPHIDRINGVVLSFVVVPYGGRFLRPGLFWVSR